MKRTTLIPLLLIPIALFSLVAAGRLLLQDRYAVYIGDDVITVEGDYATVGDVLAAGNVDIGSADRVYPAIDNLADTETAIRVDRARVVSLRSEDQAQTYQTHQTTILGFFNEIGLQLQRADEILADDVRVDRAALATEPLPASLEIGRFHTVTIRDNGQQQVVRTAAQTVGQLLDETSLILYATDGVEPPAATWVSEGMVIDIQRSRPLQISVDGRLVQTRSYHTSSLDVLAEAGIGLVGADFVKPAPNVALNDNDLIEVIRVTEDFAIIDEPIPFDSYWQGTDLWEIDTVGLLSAGDPGILRQRIRIRYENGVEVSRMVDGEWVAKPATNEVLGYGTQIVIRTLDTPFGTIEYWRKVEMRVTSYTAATSGKERDHPTYGITASGVIAGYGVVAVDPRVVPFRSDVYVPDYGIGFVGDTGGGVLGRWIDLGYEEDALTWWAGYTDVYYLTPVPELDRINFQIPRVLP